MNRYMLKFYSELKLNIFGLIKDILPTDLFDSSFFESYEPINMEFSSKLGSRCLSTFIDEIVNNYADFIDGVYVGILPEGQLIIKSVISDRYKSKWSKLNDLWNTEYDPLKPFDITLDENISDILDVTEDISSSSTDNTLYGFNSIEPVNSNGSKSENTNKYKRENPRTRRYTRTGNIGNTSFQDLVVKEREVLKYQIIDTIFKDIATVICRNKYL